MSKNFTYLLDALDKPFYFGIGGIGDLLLLMATVNEKEYDVVFVPNNMNPVRNLLNANLFPGLSRAWLFPRQSFDIGTLTYNQIVSHHLFRGAGVTPKNFDYIGDWNECGKTDVFRYYGVNRYPEWARPNGNKYRHAVTVIQPFGGEDDKTKIKRIPEEKLYDIIMNRPLSSEVVVIGSPREIDYLTNATYGLGFPCADPIGDDSFISFETDIVKAFEWVRNCNYFYGADSWGKTLACLGCKPTVVYANEYTVAPKLLFGQDRDPGDYVFLDNWPLIMKASNE